MVENKWIKVWDPLLRVFHWSLVVGYLLAWVTADEWMSLHEKAGYFIIGLLLVRLLWGFIGTRHARFSDFVYSPARIKAYVQELMAFRPGRYVGHNPLGGLMILVLMATLMIASLTGIAAYGEEVRGFYYEGSEFFEEIHEFFANLSLFLVAVHLLGVAVGSLLHRENLVKAMVTGNKQE
jgi:cytochrome b